MSWSDTPHPRPQRSEQELLALVYAKARARGSQRRAQSAVAAACTVVLVAGLATVATRGEGTGRRQLRTAAGGAPTSVPPPDAGPAFSASGPVPPSTSVLPSILPAVPPTVGRRPVTPTTPPSVVPGGAAAGAPPVPMCLNSYDRTCGPASWSPPPAPNRPLMFSVAVTPQAPKVGEPVTFHVTVDDADATIMRDCSSEQYGDGLAGLCALSACPPRFGAWTPVAMPDHWETTFEHTYTGAGSYVATFEFNSGGCGTSEAYRSDGGGAVPVTVSP